MLQTGGPGGGVFSRVGVNGSKALTPPLYNSEGFSGTCHTIFLVYSFLVWLCVVAPFHFAFMRAPNLFVVSFLSSMPHGRLL